MQITPNFSTEARKFWDLVCDISRKHQIDPCVVMAVISVESSYDPWAVRYEPKWRWWLNPRNWSKRNGITEPTERVCQQTSWGLMQVMGTVARERGHTGPLTELCDPRVGVEIGCRHLVWLLGRHMGLKEALSAYNTGRPNTKAGSAYADKVLSRVKAPLV